MTFMREYDREYDSDYDIDRPHDVITKRRTSDEIASSEKALSLSASGSGLRASASRARSAVGMAVPVGD